MNHCVPDFETEDDYLLPASSNLKRHKKSTMGDEDIMELLWQNGQVVMQNQNQRLVINHRKVDTTSSRLIEDETTPCNLFIQEDEMVSWLHYPNEDNSLDLYLHNNDIFPITTAGDLSSQPQLQPPLPPPPPPPSITVPSPSLRPPIAPVKQRSENFLHFSRAKNLPESAPANSHTVTQSTVVESNDRPLQANMCNYGGAGTSSAGREPETYDISGSSSPVTGGSGASASVEPSSSKQKVPPVTEDRKRKGTDVDDTECYSEDVEFEYHDGKKQSRGSTSTKRTRAAEVHNLSERRRRDRINEKMKALQELIPRCNKSDKASMLDEAIEYLKSLQMQVQMMSMGYGMVPMMFPGVQRYMPTMAAAMGMGMGMDQVGINRPMVPYPPILPGPAMPNPTATPHLTPRFPIPRFQMAQVPIMGPTRNQTANPSDPTMNPFPIQSANQSRMLPFADPFQQYHGLPQSQFPQPQNQTGIPAITSKPSSSRDVKNPEHQSTGKNPFG